MFVSILHQTPLLEEKSTVISLKRLVDDIDEVPGKKMIKVIIRLNNGLD